MSEATTYTITAEDIKVLRTAARAKYDRTVRRYLRVEVFVRSHAATLYSEGRISVCTSYDNGGFVEQNIPAQAQVRNYGGDRRAAGRYVAANDHTPFTEGEATLLTNLANTVRAGDVLSVNFVLANHTKALAAAGFDHDKCTVSIYRRGVLFATFVVDERVTAHGSLTFSDHRYAAA